MSDFGSNDAPQLATKRQFLVKRLRLIALLIVIIVGILGGYQIWNLVLASDDYIVAVEPAIDLYGDRQGSPYETGELLEHLDYQLILDSTGESMMSLPAARNRSAKLTVTGSAHRKEVKDQRIKGLLQWPGSTTDALRLELDLATVEEDTIRQILSYPQAAEFFSRKVNCNLGILNQFGDPVTGLQRDGMVELEGKRGVYEISISVDEFFFEATLGNENYGFNVREADGSTTWAVEFPLLWFIGEGNEQRVIDVEQQVDLPVILPRPDGYSPRKVVAGPSGGWDGRLRVEGSDLDLAKGAYLQSGGQRVDLNVIRARDDHLVVGLDPARLSAGRYQLVVVAETGESLPLPSRFEVEAGAWWRGPSSGQSFTLGEEVSLRWGSSSPGDRVLVEGSVDRNSAEWTRLAEGTGGSGEARWSTADMPIGVYVLRLTVIGRTDLAPRYREIEILPPPTVKVLLRFKKKGVRYANITELWIDGERVDMGADPRTVLVDLTRGVHEWKAVDSFGQYTSHFTVESEDQVFDLDLDR